MICRLSLAATLAALVCAVGAGPAAGSAFYNSSESGQPNPAKLRFSCGVFCSNSWDINVGASAARPGEGGSFHLANVGDFTNQASDACDPGGGHPDVQNHGWAELHYQSPSDRRFPGAYQWRMGGNDNQWVSGSPFSLQLGSQRFSEKTGPYCNPP